MPNNSNIDTDKYTNDCENKINLTKTGTIIKNVSYSNGYLKIIIGCMFSGKTSYIINECNKWNSIDKNVLMINYSEDKRYSDKDMVINHDLYGIDCIMLDKLANLKDILDYDVILINEGQFFKDLKYHANYWSDVLKKIVIVSGLDGDYLRGKFGEIIDLIPDCDEIVKLTAYCSTCKDGTSAIFTWKIKNELQKQIDIGGIDKYIPLCRKHYNEVRYSQ